MNAQGNRHAGGRQSYWNQRKERSKSRHSAHRGNANSHGDERDEKFKGSRSGSRHSSRSRQAGRRSSFRESRNSSNEVNYVNNSEYNFDERNQNVDNSHFDLQGSDNSSDLKREFIEVVYNEGNHDIDPFKAIIDSGCPKTVTGRPWLDAFIEGIKGDLKIKRTKENERFKFGPSQIFTSTENYELKVVIGNLNEVIRVSVVDADIPLLLGLDYQRKWGIILDIGKNELFIRKSGETFPISSSSNYWTLLMQGSSLHEHAHNLVFSVDLDKLTKAELRKHIVKMHKNLCHKSEEHMVRLFKVANKDTSEIRNTIKSVVSTCNICKRFKKTPPRPRVAMPKAYTTNEVVSVDLKEIRSLHKYILYMCDEFSGYIIAEVIKNKNPETVVEAFNRRWVRDGPGIPEKGIFC